MNFAVNLGKSSYGGATAGQIQLEADYPNTNLYRPAALQLIPGPGVLSVSTSGALRQVLAPAVLMDVVTSNNSAYEMDFYSPGSFGTTLTNGLYPHSGTPYKTIAVSNPNLATTNQLQFVETFAGKAITNAYQWSATAQAWAMVTGNGLRQETRTKIWQGNTFFETNIVSDAYGNVAFSQVETYQVPVPGMTNLIQRVVNPGGSLPQTNQWIYTTSYITNVFNDTGYTNIATNVVLTLATGPFGDWTRYEYDSNAVLTATVTGVGDLTPAAADAQCRVLTTITVNDSNGGSITTNITTLQGQEVSRSYHYSGNAVTTNITCQTPGAAWNASNNLVSVTLYYTNTAGPSAYQVMETIQPDGTISLYTYTASADGTLQTNTVTTGANSGGTVTDGTRTVTVSDAAGHVLSTQTYDVASGLLTAQSVNYLDSLGRPTNVVSLTGTQSIAYTCCGIDSQTDQQGLQTSYSYDDLKQVTATTRMGVTTGNTLDAMGRSLFTTRNGTQTGATTYDLGGNQLTAVDAMSNTNIYTQSLDASNHLVQTTTLPNGATQINTYYLDGTLLSRTGTGAHGVRYVYGADTNGQFTQTIPLRADGSDSVEWTKSYTDMAGHNYLTVYADGASQRSVFNAQGQLAKQTDPDGVTTLYGYNAKGQQVVTAVDLNGNGIIGGSDRISSNVTAVVQDDLGVVQQTMSYAYGNAGPVLNSISEGTVDGLTNRTVSFGQTNLSVTTIDRTDVQRTVVTTMPDGSSSVSFYTNGLLASQTRYDANVVQLSAVNNQYDSLNRLVTSTDARNGATSYTYNNADQVVSVTAPLGQTTTTLYDSLNRPYSVIQPDGTTVNSVYLLTGELGLQYGSRTYPVAYGYDYAGRMQYMTNWSSFGSLANPRVTTWIYDGQRGWLNQKLYDDGHGPTYTYTPAGRLATRTWVRGITTTYGYDAAGSLTNTAYSDGTPSVANTYDQLGRLSSVTLGNGLTDVMTYSLANQLLSEAFTGGSLAGLAITNQYDQYLRRTSLSALASGSTLTTANYGYDAASRLANVNDGNGNSANYAYLANSPLLSQITFQQGGTTRMTTVKNYDYLNRLTAISSQPGAPHLASVSFNYNYNNANQRTNDTLADGSYWVYQYDSLGQVTNGIKHFADGTLVPGQQFGYLFDDIGNRTQTQTGGDAAGANRHTNNYAANTLNQITQRDVPGAVDVMGAGLAVNPVTVNGQSPYRKGEYFRNELAVNNTNSAVWTNIIVTATNQASVTGNVYVAQTPEQFSYDADGNLTNDGRWAYTWDAENRLTKMVVNTNVGPQYTLNFAYDSKSRRIQKMVSTNGVGIYTNKFLYDGWNLIATLSPNSQLLSAYTWGTDLSGSMQGAGGVGGLLEVSYYGSSTTNCFPAYDGNGNIMALVNAADGTVAANYDYAAFGEPIRITGVMARNNPFRFSTKYADDESDLLYYGYRYYKPSTGTWLNKDPLYYALSGEGARYDLLRDCGLTDKASQSIAERPPEGNDYLFVKNAAAVFKDILGLCVPLPDSGAGTFDGNLIGHQWPFRGRTSYLTFKVSCPTYYPYLVNYGVASTGPPFPETGHNNSFPGNYVTHQEPTGDGPDYTITIVVTSTATLDHYQNYPGFVGTIRIVGSCCCSRSGTITRSDPATNPGTYSPAPNPGNPTVPVF